MLSPSFRLGIWQRRSRLTARTVRLLDLALDVLTNPRSFADLSRDVLRLAGVVLNRVETVLDALENRFRRVSRAGGAVGCARRRP